MTQQALIERRLKVPFEWVSECWQLVDRDKLKKKIAERLEGELADRMVNHMAAYRQTHRLCCCLKSTGDSV